MIVRVITVHGSIYRLDSERGLWKRTFRTELSGQLRMYQGKFNFYEAVLGQPLVIRCPSQVIRSIEEIIITTSAIIRIVYGRRANQTRTP